MPNAGKALDLGRNRSYELTRAGKFPVRIITIGQTYRVPVAELLAVLGATTAQVNADVA